MNTPVDPLEVAVVGGGPAGSTVAAELARRGHRVGLFERDRFPRDKVCGEFLSPETIELFRTLGCLDDFQRFEPPSIRQIRLTAPGAHGASLTIPDQAYGLSRKTLDAWLFERARRLGVQCFEGVVVRRIRPVDEHRRRLFVRRSHGQQSAPKTVDANLVICAHGRRSRLDRTLKRPFFDKRSPYVAFKRHHRMVRNGCAPPLDGVVELHSFDGGYCGISFVEDEVVNVCAMFERRHLADCPRPVGDGIFSMLATKNQALANRMATLQPRPTNMLTIAQIPLMPRKMSGDGVLFVGDAAGMIAPLAGDGQAMAIESGLLLAQLIDGNPRGSIDRLWATRWNRRYRRRLFLGRVLQRLLTRHPITAAALAVIRRAPLLGQTLVKWTRTTT